ncbi:MAG TPA: hypothetical protein VGE59_02890 [Patescibacteria group bacterium]
MEQEPNHDPRQKLPDWEAEGPDPEEVREAEEKQREANFEHEKKVFETTHYLNHVVETQFDGRTYEDLSSEDKLYAITLVNRQHNTHRVNTLVAERNSGVQGLKHKLDDKLGRSKIWGFAKNIALGAGGSLAMRTMTAGLVATGGFVGGAISGAGAGIVTGSYRGWSNFNKEQLNFRALENEIGANELITKGLHESPQEIEQEYGSLEAYYSKVHQALATYREIEKSNLLSDNREYVSRFYENLASLESISQIQGIKQQAESLGRDPTPEEAADLLCKALNQRELANVERFDKGLAQKAQEFVRTRKSERLKTTVKQGLIGGATGAVLGGTVGWLLELVFHSPTAAPTGEKINIPNIAGGGHTDPSLAQDYAIHNKQFLDVTEAIRNGNTQEAITQGWQIHLNLDTDPSVVTRLHEIAQQSNLSPDEYNRLAYNVLTYANREGIDNNALLTYAQQAITDPHALQSLSPQAQQSMQEIFGTTHLTRDSFINAHEFRNLSTIDTSTDAYYHHLKEAGALAQAGIDRTATLVTGSSAAATVPKIVSKFSPPKEKINPEPHVEEEEEEEEVNDEAYINQELTFDNFENFRIAEVSVLSTEKEIRATLPISSGENANVVLHGDITDPDTLRELTALIDQIESGANKPTLTAGYTFVVSRAERDASNTLSLYATLKKTY